MKKQPITDAVLLEAIRQRMMDEIGKQRETNVINNLIGGGSDALPAVRGSRGVGEFVGQANPSSAGEGLSPEDMDYLVDITREDLPGLNPDTGKPRGWKKTVHRYRAPKGDSKPPKKGRSA